MNNERPTPLIDDLEGTRSKLQHWFNARLGTPVTVSELTIPEATGMSNVTLLFDIRYEQGGRPVQQGCVGRLQPEIARPLFPEYDLALQYRVMDILGRRTEVRAPPLLGLEEDPSVLGTPFYIMARIDGRVPGDMPPYTMGGWLMEDTRPDQRKRIWEAGVCEIAKIHRLDYRALGFDFLAHPADGATALQQQLRYWENYLSWGMEGQANPICAGALAWLRGNQPRQEPTTLCWGDARIGNMMFGPDGQVSAVLDWEMVTLGNPLQDIMWWWYMDRFFSAGIGLPRLEGLPDRAATLALWEAESGFSSDDAHYYEVFAGLRYGLIMSRIMVGSGQTDQVASNFALSLLETVLSEG
ncbi:MAG: phosphotransferase family protein [Spongiibacteraceae bacterium]|nr:phosphotransferase family protein [Spongiibacteraceae bacterium]